MPLMLQLTPEQQIEYARIADELNAIGLRDRAVRQSHHRREGGARRRSAPADLEKAAVRDSGDRRERAARALSLDDMRRSIAASIACRAAIKINTRLDAGQDGVAARARWRPPIAR